MTWDDHYLWTLDYSTGMIYQTEPGEQTVQRIPVELPSWFPLLFLLTITPVIMSVLTAWGEEQTTKKTFENEEDPTSIVTILYIAAIIGSLYTAYELFRIIYNVVFLNKIVYRGDSPLWIFRFEMLLCLYTFIFWLTYSIYKGLLLVKKRKR